MFISGPPGPGLGDGKIKIIDFGSATKLGRGKKITYECAGTANYMSPEMILGNYSHKTDIWSIGVIAWIMITLKQPYEGETDE